MTIPDQTRNEDKATEWPVFQKFRRIAEEAMSRCGLNTEMARVQVNELFRDGVVGAYYERVLIPRASDEQSQAEVARKIGTDPGTYSKWIKRGVPPKSDKFVLLASATDAKFPRGANAALRGFCKAFDGVQVRLGQTSARLSASQALSLWAVFRTQEWWEAHCSKDPHNFCVATANIRDRMKEYRRDAERMSVSEIQSVIDRRLLAWTALELIITHEWL